MNLGLRVAGKVGGMGVRKGYYRYETVADTWVEIANALNETGKGAKAQKVWQRAYSFAVHHTLWTVAAHASYYLGRWHASRGDWHAARREFVTAEEQLTRARKRDPQFRAQS